jgi:hypothetical protein
METIPIPLGMERLFGTEAALVGLTDASGKVVRVALSSEEYRRYLYRTAKPPISEEDLARYMSETEGGSLDEFWRRMGVR